MRAAPGAALRTLLPLLLVAGGGGEVSREGAVARLAAAWAHVPAPLVALGGDVRVRLGGLPQDLRLTVRLAREDDEGRSALATLPLTLDDDGRLTLPCGYFSRGGLHYLELHAAYTDNYLDYDTLNYTIEEKRDVKRDVGNGSLVTSSDGAVKTWSFDVLWPVATLDVTPEHIQTYPEQQVTAIVEFPRAVCSPVHAAADYWLELLYCGHAGPAGAAAGAAAGGAPGSVLCDGRNISSQVHVLYSEQMHGFPGRRSTALRCELFGLAGDYVLSLRPAAAAPAAPPAAAYIKADWSEQFVLNVRGGSVLPCGEGGVRALFQYPACALDGADRVRVFGRDHQRLRYVAERRVRRGQHSATFDCRLFSERFPEYCFVYVSQALTGAVADVRMDCLPTAPPTEGGAGAWGAWSAWSACAAPARCWPRTRSRHRFCDSPPPAYGRNYCEVRLLPSHYFIY